MEPKTKEQEPILQGSNIERDNWLDSLEYIVQSVVKNRQSESVPLVLEKLATRLRDSGIKIPFPVHTPYINTIPVEKEPPYPGNREIERRIKSIVRWNAMAMVVKANRLHSGLGGHISTYASCATLYEVGFNHFFQFCKVAILKEITGLILLNTSCSLSSKTDNQRVSLLSWRSSRQGCAIRESRYPSLFIHHISIQFLLKRNLRIPATGKSSDESRVLSDGMLWRWW